MYFDYFVLVEFFIVPAPLSSLTHSLQGGGLMLYLYKCVLSLYEFLHTRPYCPGHL